MLCISSIGFSFFFFKSPYWFYALNEAIVFCFGGWFVYSFFFLPHNWEYFLLVE